MISVKRKTNVVKPLLKRLEKIKNNNPKVQSGYFPSTGIHQGSGESYAQLMDLHEYGFDRSVFFLAPRPVRQITMLQLRSNKSLWLDDVRGYIKGTKTLNQSLNKIGLEITETAKNVFGSSLLLPNSPVTVSKKGGRNTPLVDTGDLKDHWSWKVKLI